jgi:sarcosine oxidase subunit beta
VAVSRIVVADDNVCGVETNTGRIPADVVINAAGAWGLGFMSELGHDLPITFSRHPMALVRRPADRSRPHPVVLDVHTDSYFLPKGNQTLIGKLGTMAQDEGVDPETYERGVSNEEIDRYLAAARIRLPYLTRGAIQGGWAGIYDDSIDAHPVVDAVPGANGLFCALGMSGNCFKLSPIIGLLLANRIIDGQLAASDLDHFRFSRFFDGSMHERAFGTMSVLA